uniref:Secreted protein n=1 Tax=Anguilla anguilla TaxID=7936 RepID=A0A0E9X3Z3_ANGAN
MCLTRVTSVVPWFYLIVFPGNCELFPHCCDIPSQNLPAGMEMSVTVIAFLGRVVVFHVNNSCCPRHQHWCTGIMHSFHLYLCVCARACVRAVYVDLVFHYKCKTLF